MLAVVSKKRMKRSNHLFFRKMTSAIGFHCFAGFIENSLIVRAFNGKVAGPGGAFKFLLEALVITVLLVVAQDFAQAQNANVAAANPDTEPRIPQREAIKCGE